MLLSKGFLHPKISKTNTHMCINFAWVYKAPVHSELCLRVEKKEIFLELIQRKNHFARLNAMNGVLFHF